MFAIHPGLETLVPWSTCYVWHKEAPATDKVGVWYLSSTGEAMWPCQYFGLITKTVTAREHACRVTLHTAIVPEHNKPTAGDTAWTTTLLPNPHALCATQILQCGSQADATYSEIEGKKSIVDS